LAQVTVHNHLGLIVAELINNAARHGADDASILVRLDLTGGEIRCSVFNEGMFGTDGPSGHGLQLAEGVASELDGRLERHFGPQGALVLVAASLDAGTFPKGAR
jgi:two-component sensor histidine kinase